MDILFVLLLDIHCIQPFYLITFMIVDYDCFYDLGTLFFIIRYFPHLLSRTINVYGNLFPCSDICSIYLFHV